jgi:enoyl-CoA hydratase
MSLVHIEARGSARVLRLNEPKRRNLLSAALCSALSAAIAEANADPDAKAIVITGAPPAFCAGANLDDLEAAVSGETATLHLVYQSFMDVANSKLPTIAAVNGVAVGAGFNLALACDMRLASQEARFDCRFLNIGLHPGGGHSWMLIRAVGWANAAQMLLLNRAMDADAAKAIGLVHDVVSAGSLLDCAVDLARLADALPRNLIVRTKQSMRIAAVSTHEATFAHENVEQLHSLHQPPFKELVLRLKGNIASRKP